VTRAFARVATLSIALVPGVACGVGEVAWGASDDRAPERYRVQLETSRGAIVLLAERSLAPRGADRFYVLVRAGYYDDSRFFRVVPGKWAQFGIAGEPSVAAAWRGRTFPDDPPRAPNLQGAVAFAFAENNGRTTQLFINLTDNRSTLDAQGFAPFAHVVAGMNVVLALNGEYGETSGGGIRAGRQEPMFREGNAWLDREFPRLDRILRATILPTR
jgi:peptidyl-prolyl cis-trans isomerase A (cyclophilin A)